MSLRDELERDDGSYPASWKPEVGDILVGKILRYERFRNKDGNVSAVAIVQPEEGGKAVSVFVSTTSMRDQFDELKPRVGETVGIKRLPVEEGKNYKRFRVLVEGRTGSGGVPDFGVTREEPLPSTGGGYPSSPGGHEPPPLDDKDIPF